MHAAAVTRRTRGPHERKCITNVFPRTNRKKNIPELSSRSLRGHQVSPSARGPPKSQQTTPHTSALSRPPVVVWPSTLLVAHASGPWHAPHKIASRKRFAYKPSVAEFTASVENKVGEDTRPRPSNVSLFIQCASLHQGSLSNNPERYQQEQDPIPSLTTQCKHLSAQQPVHALNCLTVFKEAIACVPPKSRSLLPPLALPHRINDMH